MWKYLRNRLTLRANFEGKNSHHENKPSRNSKITPERESELYEAVLDLLREVGYHALTMDAIAERTHSSKATLYRRGTKNELIINALRHQKSYDMAEINTGTLRGDLQAIVLRQDDSQMERNSQLMRSLAVAAHANIELLHSFREYQLVLELEEMRRALQRAVDRGEILADNLAIDYIPHLLIGCFAARTLIDHLPPTQAFLTPFIDAAILPALSTRPLT
nr:TetR/AcrR family transcriptional regulator [Streptomyces sp. RPA4-2]